MKKITILSVMLLLGGLITIASLSSFKGKEQKKETFSETHFKFSELVSATNANLKNPLNWQVVSAVPDSNPCTPGTNAPCIIRVGNTAAGISPSQTDAQKVNALVSYITSIETNEEIPPVDLMADENVYLFRRQ